MRRSVALVVSVAVVLIVGLPVAGNRAIITVGPGGPPTYDYASIQDAITAAGTGDEVVVAAGTYYEHINFNGKAITVRSEDPSNPAVVATTIISGSEPAATKNGPLPLVTFNSGEGADAVLAGFTITDGNAYYGGGIYCNGASPTIQNNTISDNHAIVGGGIYCYEAPAAIRNNNIVANDAGKGGGIYCEDCSPTIEGNTISDNVGDSGPPGQMEHTGGGIFCWNSGSPTIRDNTITGNFARGGGGIGWSLGQGSPSIQNNIIMGNEALDGGGIDGAGGTIENNIISGNIAEGGGGGISCGGATVRDNTISDNESERGGGICCGGAATVESNTITGNEAKWGGGVFCGGDPYSANYEPTIRNNTISGNHATGTEEVHEGGGGIACYQGYSGTIQSNTITDNVAALRGGGILCYYDCSPSIENNTIGGNQAPDGGGIYSAFNSSPTVHNCIIAFSPVGAGIETDGTGSPTVSYCDVYGNAGGDDVGIATQTRSNGNICEDPLFAHPAMDDYHLKSRMGRWVDDVATRAWVQDHDSSPCIDAGDPADPVGDEPDPNGSRINMGAYGGTEYASKTNQLPTVTGVEITPDPAYTDTDLTAVPGESNDPDGHPVTLAYQWQKAVVGEKDGERTWEDIDGETSETLSSGNFDKHDQIRVVCTPDDGGGATKEFGSPVYAETTIMNKPPEVAGVEIGPDPAYTDDDLTATPSGWNDADGDAEGYVWTWQKAVVGQKSGKPTWEDIDGATSETLSSGNFDKGDQIRVICTPEDGSGRVAGEPVTDEITISNSPPTQPTVDVTPDAPRTTDDLSVTASGSTDLDEDEVTYSYRWYKDDVHQAAYDNESTVPSEATASGEVWRCEVTPNDGEEDGPSGQDEVRIQNTPPTVQSVEISPDPAYTDDDLIATPVGWEDADEDVAGFLWQWQKHDGEDWQDIAGATTDTLDHSNFVKGDQIKVICTPEDGAGRVMGEPVTDEITISNSPPTQPTVDVTPDAPRTTDDLSVTASGSTDLDEDEVAYGYKWYKDDVHQAAYDNATTVPSEATASGEVWRCEVTPNDGEEDGPSGQDEVTIQNTPPSVASVEITPDPAYTDDDLIATPVGWEDADEDVAGFLWQWQKWDGESWQDIPGATTDTLDHSNFVKGDQIKVICTPEDGAGRVMGEPVTDEITISNRPPTQPTVDVTPDAPRTTDDLSVTASGSTDLDQDEVTYSYRWYKDDVHQAAYDDEATVPHEVTASGEVWRCEVTPNDGEENGPPAQDEVRIQNTPPSISGVSVAPERPYSYTDLTATPEGWYDADDDPEDYEWVWQKDEADKGFVVIAGEETNTLGEEHFDAGDIVRVICTPTDGKEAGEPVAAEVAIESRRPQLKWLGAGAEGYEQDGVEAEHGAPDEEFVWKVEYVDPGNRPPVQVLVHVVQMVDDQEQELAGSPFAMAEAKDYEDGEVFEYAMQLAEMGAYRYWFEAWNAEETAFGEPTWRHMAGPLVKDFPPRLEWLGTAGYEDDGLDPDQATRVDRLVWKIKYVDLEDQPAAHVLLHIAYEGAKDSEEITGSPFAMRTSQTQYASGVVYHFARHLRRDGVYRYWFEASDGTQDAVGEPAWCRKRAYLETPPDRNLAPRLTWAGLEGYEQDGLDPEEGEPGTRFIWKVKYSDGNGDAPADGVKLHVAKVTGKQDKPLEEIAGSPFEMSCSGASWQEGQLFYRARVLRGEGRYRYWFEASDGELAAIGEPTWHRMPGPSVQSDRPPRLSWVGTYGYEHDGVARDQQSPANTFIWKVCYTDLRGDPADYVRVHIFREELGTENELPGSPFEMAAEKDAWDEGVVFAYTRQLTEQGLYGYWFEGSDGECDAIGEPTWHHMRGPLVEEELGAGPLAVVCAASARTGTGGAQVTFTLSAASTVDVTVLNIAGRMIRGICTAKALPSGSHTLIWDGRNAAGLAVPSGTYLVCITVRGEYGDEAQALICAQIAR